MGKLMFSLKRKEREGEVRMHTLSQFAELYIIWTYGHVNTHTGLCLPPLKVPLVHVALQEEGWDQVVFHEPFEKYNICIDGQSEKHVQTILKLKNNLQLIPTRSTRSEKSTLRV